MKKRYNVLILNMNTIETNRINGIEQFGRKHGWNLSFESINGFGFNLSQNWNGDGIVALFEDRNDHRRQLRSFCQRGIPVVDVVDFLDAVPRAKVVADNRAIGRMGAVHFNERHHLNALYVCNMRNAVSNARADGFAEAWKGERFSTLALAEDLPKSVLHDYSTLLCKIGEVINSQKKPLAVFAFNDFVAVQVLNACNYMGIAVPQEVSILGVDDNRLLCENQSCPLSSVQHDLFTIGYRAAEMLQRMMNRSRTSLPPPLTIPPLGIKVRRSTDYVAVSDPIVKEACEYIRSHIGSRFGVQQIAEALSVPRYLLDERFMKEMGHSVGVELRRLQLLIAKKRLLETDDKISTIARETGFCHATYLVKVFKREFSVSPRQFRMNARREQIEQ